MLARVRVDPSSTSDRSSAVSSSSSASRSSASPLNRSVTGPNRSPGPLGRASPGALAKRRTYSIRIRIGPNASAFSSPKVCTTRRVLRSTCLLKNADMPQKKTVSSSTRP